MEAGMLWLAPDEYWNNVKWFKEGEKPKSLGRGGEQLPYSPGFFMEIGGHLCRGCVTLVLKWPEPAPASDNQMWPFINFS
jgi:hypothetical protein